MANQLINTVTSGALASGASIAVAHNLNISGRKVQPDIFARIGTGFTLAFDDTNVTFTNNNAGDAICQVFVQYFHSYLRSFGASSNQTLSISPFELGSDGINANSSLIGILGTNLSTYAITVWIDGVNGSDANSGIAQGSPLKTVPSFYDKFAWFYLNGGEVIVNLAGGGGFGASATSQLVYSGLRSFFQAGFRAQPAIRWRGPQMVPFTPATGVATPTLDPVTPTEIVDQTNVANPAGRRTKFNFTAPGWTANDLRNNLAWIRVRRGGELRFFEVPITGNGVADCYVDGGALAVGQVVNTDEAMIVTPGVILRGEPASDNGSKILISGTNGYGDAGNTNGHPFERVILDGAIVFNGNSTGFDRCGFQGSNVDLNGGVVAMIGCKSKVSVSWGSHSENFYQCRIDSATSPAANRFFQSALAVSNGGTAQLLIGADRGGQGATWNLWYNLTVNGSTAANAIRSSGNATQVHCAANNGSITGRDNTGIGLNARYGANVQVGSGGQFATITAAGGDITVGTGTNASTFLGCNWGTGAGQFQEAIGYNGNFKRDGGTAAVPVSDNSRIGVV